MGKRMANRGIFYTYLWLREDGTPYYAGKGIWSRITEKHRRHGASPPKHLIVYQDWPSVGKKRAYQSRPNAKGGAHLKGKPWSKARRMAQEKRVSIRVS
jgi:hypothetical protein